jgi:hypothetical protein
LMKRTRRDAATEVVTLGRGGVTLGASGDEEINAHRSPAVAICVLKPFELRNRRIP